MSCIEHDFSKVAHLRAYRKPVLDIYFPVYANRNYVTSADYGISGDGSYIDINFKKSSLKCSDKTTTSVSGYVHTVSLEWESVPLSSEDLSQLVDLQRYAYDIEVVYFGGMRKFIRTDSTPYKFIFQDDNGIMKSSMTLVNGQGLIMIV